MAIKDLLIKVGIKGAKNAEKEVKGVDKSFGSLAKSAAKVGAVFYAAKGVVTGLQRTVELAAAQELAEKKLTNALGKRSDALLKQASALQQLSTAGDEAIIEQQSFLASLKFTEEQIKNIIPAALDLSAATGISLESAVRNTSKTFSGMTGELGELVPQLRDLTKEEMMAGEAVKVLGDLFAGQARAEVETMAGSIAQMNNAIGDAGEEIGFVLEPAVIFLTKTLKKGAESVGGFFNFIGKIDFSETAKNVIGNASALITAIQKVGQAYFDLLPDLFKSSFGRIVEVVKNAMTTTIEIVKSVGSFIFEPISIGAELIAAKIKNVFIGMFNLIKEQFNNFADTFMGEKLGLEKLEMSDLVDTEGIVQELSDSGLIQHLGKIFGNEDDIQNLSDFTEKQKEIWAEYFNTVAVLSKDSEDQVIEGEKKKEKATEESTDTTKTTELEKSIAAGQSAQSVGDAVRGVIKARFAQAVADILATEISSKGLIGLVTGAAGAAAASSLFDSLIPKFADGGIVPGNPNTGDSVPSLLTPGEVILNQAQQDNLAQGMGGITLNVSAPLVDESIIDTIIPAIEKVQQGNLA